MRENYVRQQSRASAFKQKRNLLGTNLFASGLANMTMRADPGIHAIVWRIAISFDDDGTTGVVLSNFRHQLRVLVQRACFFAVNSKIHKRSAGHCAFAVLPEFFQLLVDLADSNRKSGRICFTYGGHRSESPPRPTVAGEQIIRCLWAP